LPKGAGDKNALTHIHSQFLTILEHGGDHVKES